MAFDALVHRANAILYFSYWPRAAATWASVATLNRDIERLVPWLLAAGEEKPAKSSEAAIEVRAKQVGDGWMVLAVNTLPRAIDAELKVGELGNATLRMPFDAKDVNSLAGRWRERFAAYEAKAYLVGDTPAAP
jgi:hypothetical protein